MSCELRSRAGGHHNGDREGVPSLRLPGSCPWPPARPCLTSGSDQGHNVLASGQGLAAGRQGREAGQSVGDRQGGEKRREKQRERQKREIQK